MLKVRQGDEERAEACFRAALDAGRTLDDKRLKALSLRGLAYVATSKGDLKRALSLIEESVSLAREANKWNLATSVAALGRIKRIQGDYDSAARSSRESLLLRRELGEKYGVSQSLAELAMVAALQARPRQAARLFGAAEALRETLSTPLWPIERDRYEHAVAVAREALGKEEFAAAWAEGRAMPIEQAIEDALATEPVPMEATERSAVVGEPGPLTPREREVAALIAQGLTNREIASHLVISERTAESHVQHILDKLDLNTRGRIGVWAIEHGLYAPPQT